MLACTTLSFSSSLSESLLLLESLSLLELELLGTTLESVECVVVAFSALLSLLLLLSLSLDEEVSWSLLDFRFFAEDSSFGSSLVECFSVALVSFRFLLANLDCWSGLISCEKTQASPFLQDPVLAKNVQMRCAFGVISS